MDESTAWLLQAVSDREAAESLAAAQRSEVPCHAIAKWQQAVEKAIKALVAALRDAGVLHIQIGYTHEVARLIDVLVRLPHAADTRNIQQQLHGFLNQATRAGIRNLDGLVPRRPPPGQNPGRNTEYPLMMRRADGLILLPRLRFRRKKFSSFANWHSDYWIEWATSAQQSAELRAEAVRS